MIRSIINWFNVKHTGESFWDKVASQTVYTFEYKHNGERFLATSRFSFFRVKITPFDIPLNSAWSDIAQTEYEKQFKGKNNESM